MKTYRVSFTDSGYATINSVFEVIANDEETARKIAENGVLNDECKLVGTELIDLDIEDYDDSVVEISEGKDTCNHIVGVLVDDLGIHEITADRSDDVKNEMDIKFEYCSKCGKKIN